MVIELYQLIINFVQVLFIGFFFEMNSAVSVKYLKEFTNYTFEAFGMFLKGWILFVL